MAGWDETTVGLEMCRDIYKKYMVNCNINELVDIYDKAGRQLYNLYKSLVKVLKDELRNR